MRALRYSRLGGAQVGPDIRPRRKHPTDAGIDLFAAEATTIPPISIGGIGTVRTGIMIDIPAGTMLLLKPKSRHDFILGAGVVDAGYQGEVLVKVVNLSNEPLSFEKGDPVAQAVHLSVHCLVLEEVPAKELFHVGTLRGSTGGILETKF